MAGKTASITLPGMHDDLINAAAGAAACATAKQIETSLAWVEGPSNTDAAEEAARWRRRRMPIILTSRADKTLTRLGSCAIALLVARHKTGVKS